MPRVRFTVRQLMAIVAIVALALVVAIPICSRLLWLYNAPLSINLVGGTVEPDWISLKHPASVGRPVPVHCLYRTSIAPSIPSGLIYKLSVEVKLIDSARTVVESHSRTHYLVAREEVTENQSKELSAALTPRQPGDYLVRYEVHATDLFGRTGMVACHTGGLTAQ